jgi:hypothetical protein
MRQKVTDIKIMDPQMDSGMFEGNFKLFDPFGRIESSDACWIVDELLRREVNFSFPFIVGR